ncbi:glycosyltransferase family 2 protein [Vibrio maritimus]|uniref:glycosyltransferase family 2 protein n=1 Tax=Vibrio maritimus TaxID=990268 RepID=UPI001F34AD7C|nr:glycosyltransferase family 2 protein [Vibrio maritimus]
MQVLLMGLFWTSAFLIVYHHAIYPLILRWWAKRHPLPEIEDCSATLYRTTDNNELPSITIIIPAYNEAEWIADKIRNCASLDYPRDKLSVVIINDGSTDDTAAIAESTIQEAICSDTLFTIVNHKDNKGKICRLNESLPVVDSAITCISDVSALISIDALKLAATHFEDSKVGVVNSTYQLLDQQERGESLYWRYQNQLKYSESTLGSTIGAHGALYFIRTGLFEALPFNTINDDFIIPMNVVRAGHQAVYEPNMNAIEMEPTEAAQDFKRRLRISAGNMQQLLVLLPLFSPQYKGTALTFFSGKGLRVLTPYLMLICLVTSAILATSSTLFLGLLVIQGSIYFTAAASVLVPVLQSVTAIRALTYLVVGHTANLIGGLRYLIGLENGAWKRTPQQENHHEKG